jgi:serine/threonine-protein kinase
MAAADWARIRALFEQAIELAADERTRFLDAQCDGDSALRAEVEAMLAADMRAGHDATAVGAMAPELLHALSREERERARDSLIGLRLGPWRLLREIGRGGMGAVYLAERDDGEYLQQAAIKLVRPGWDVGQLLQRFRAERQILATLNHPNIARLLDGGVSSDGKPYLVLEYIEGSEIGRYCNERQLDIEARLRLFLTVCEAVTHAHRRLVVHRDLKPSNIMIDGSGQVKLLDFGIAKLMQPDAGITASASRMFTPEYAAPEQVRGEAVTTGVDVYALGLLLYDLLTGRRPYGQTASTPAAYEQAILTQEPQRPSQAAVQVRSEAATGSAQLAAARNLDARQLSQRLRGDLDAIVLKALRKQPEQRYPSVGELADDVNRHLLRQPVGARRGNLRYRATRFLQRHALATALAALAVVSLVSGLAIALWQAEQARQQRDLARSEARNAGAVAEFVTGVFSSADPRNTDGYDPRAKELLAKGVAELEGRDDLQPATRAALLIALGNAHLGVSEYARGLELMERAVRKAEQDGGSGILADAYFALGYALNKNYRDDLALTQFEKAQALVSADPDADLERIENIDYMIGLELNNLGRSDEALPHLQRAYEGRAARMAPTTPELIDTTSMYVHVLSFKDRAAEALAIAERSYQALAAQPDMPLYRRKDIVSLRAVPLLQLGRYAEAEAMYREALALDEQIFGVGDERTVVSLNNVGICLSRQSRFKEAAEIIERVISIRRARHQVDDPEVAFSLVNAGNIYLREQSVDLAIRRFREALAVYGRRNETDDRQAVKGRFGLARALELHGELVEALQLSEELAATAATQGSTYLYIKDAEPDLLHARLLSALGRQPSDCAPARAVLARTDATPAIALEARILVAECAHRQGRIDEARELLRGLSGDAQIVNGLSPYARNALTVLKPP